MVTILHHALHGNKLIPFTLVSATVISVALQMLYAVKWSRIAAH